MAMKGYSAFPKFLHYKSLTIRWFNIIFRTSMGMSYLSAEIQSVYFKASAHWIKNKWCQQKTTNRKIRHLKQPLFLFLRELLKTKLAHFIFLNQNQNWPKIESFRDRCVLFSFNNSFNWYKIASFNVFIFLFVQVACISHAVTSQITLTPKQFKPCKNVHAT